MGDDVHEQLKDSLLEGNQCYVLITCGHPTEEGEMPVKMSYAGDSYLAAYLIETAQCHLDDEVLVEED